MEFSSGKAYVFGAYRLDPARRELRFHSEKLDVAPRVFDTLLALVARRGEVVEKDELMRLVWPDTVVEENNLNQTVHLLRKVLHDGEDGARYIETVPRRGYRFVADVRTIDDGTTTGSQTQKAPIPDRTPAGSSSIRAVDKLIKPSIAVGFVLLTFFAGVLVVRRYSQSSDAETREIRSLAVLPLANLSNDPDQEYFADGMTDELITDLAQVAELKVVSKTSVMQYKGTRKPLPEIGRELGVDAVVEGSVLRSGGRVRITAQLIRAATDRHLWAKTYDGDLRDVLELQSQVAEAITGEVKLILTKQERARFHSPAHLDPEAYDLYLRGRYFANQRSEASFHTAIDFYNQSAAKDPNFALAYAGLADCHVLLALWGEGRPRLPDAESNAARALSLDDGLAEAHTSLAAVKVLEWNWTEAEKEFRRALALNPNDAQAHQWYGNIFLGPQGRHEEAIAELKRAQNLDPLSPIINSDLGYAYYLAGQYNEAYRQYQKVRASDPSFLLVRYYLAQYYHVRGMYDEELQELAEDFVLSGRPKAAAEMKDLSGQQNRKELFEAMARTRGTMEDDSKSANAGSAVWFLALNKPEKALHAIETSFQMREPGLIYLAVDPEFASLHSDPRFQEMVRRIGLR